MKTIKDYTSFVNENIKIQEVVDVELDQDVIDYYLEIVESGALSKEEAIDQVANDFGISDEAVAIIIDEAGIKESVETEEEEAEEEIVEESVEEESTEEETEEEVIEESVEEEVEEETEEEIIEEAKEEDKEDDDKDEEDDKEEEKEEEKEDEGDKSDEDKYLSAKQKKLPEGLKKAIIKKAKAAEKK